MSSTVDNLEHLTPEDQLWPPKYDTLGILMVFLTSIIVGAITGVVILLLAYLAIGKFSLESGASPILLVFVTFISLTFGNTLYYAILSRIFPYIYSRGRTALSQIAAMSIILYILFIPIYVIMPTISSAPSVILMAFSAHIILNNFALAIILGLISQYRYSLLSFYSSVIALIVTAGIIILIESQISITDSSKTLFVLLGLSIVSSTLSATIANIISWLYYHMYQFSGYDPIGSVFARIEEDERRDEAQASALLTNFHNKK